MKQKVIIYGECVEKIYYFGSYYGQIYENYIISKKHKEVYSKNKHLDWVEIYNEEIDDPPFVVGDNVFMPEIEKSVMITKTARNVEGGYVYWTDYIVKLVENIQSMEEAEKKQLEHLEAAKALKEDNNVDIKPNKTWFKRFKKEVNK